MAFASEGARTPFFTSTPSNAVTLESLALTLEPKLGLGLPAMGLPSVAVAFAAFPFSVFAPSFPAMTGKAMMATTNRLNSQFFTFNIDGVPPRSGAAQALAQNMGPNVMSVLQTTLYQGSLFAVMYVTANGS
jgi:hypothetical protein